MSQSSELKLKLSPCFIIVQKTKVVLMMMEVFCGKIIGPVCMVQDNQPAARRVLHGHDGRNQRHMYLYACLHAVRHQRVEAQEANKRWMHG